MIALGVLLSVLVSLPLFSEHVDEHRLFKVLGTLEHTLQRGDVVAVDGAEIFKTQLLKEGGGQQHIFDVVADALQSPGELRVAGGYPFFEIEISLPGP